MDFFECTNSVFVATNIITGLRKRQSREGMGWRPPRSGAVCGALLAAAAGARPAAHQELAAAGAGAGQAQRRPDAHLPQDARFRQSA